MNKHLHNSGLIMIQALTVCQKLEVYGHEDLGRLYGYYEIGTESVIKKIQKGIRNGGRRRY